MTDSPLGLTDGQKTIAVLDQSRRVLEEISSLSGIGGWSYEAADNRIYWSRETRRIYEVDESFEPTPESLKSLFALGALEIQDAAIRSAIVSGAPVECEFDAITMRGCPICVKSVCRVEHVDGQVTRILGTVQDITSQRERELGLGRSERLLEEISRLTGVGGWEIDTLSQRTLWTSQIRRIFEVSDSFEPTDESVSRLLTSQAQTLLKGAMREAIRHGKSFDIEFDALTKSGRAMWLRSIGSAVWRDGQIVRVVGTLEDLTARRQAAADRRRQEYLDEQVSRLSGIGGWLFDLETKETTWSPQVRKIYEADETYNPPLEDHEKIVAPEWREAVKAARRRAVVEGLPVEVEFRALTLKGRSIWMRIVYHAERVAGRTTRLLGTAQDISAARAAQEELDALHLRLKTAVEAAELRVWEIDVDAGVLRWNHHLLPTFAQSLAGTDLGAAAALDFLHPEDRAGFEQQARQVVTSGEPSVCRVRVRAPDGGFRYLEIRMRLSSAMAERKKLFGVSRDVTKEVNLTDELVRKQHEAEESSLAKSQFVARMSHEIRTPMSGVIGMLEVLQRAEVDRTKRAHAATALKSARDLMSVLDDIIDVSQLESRHLALDSDAFSIRAVVSDVIALFETLAREKSLVLTAEIAPEVPDWVMGDPRRIRQILTNLVGNAVKFTGAGKVEVVADYDGERRVACFCVRDTGEGISDSSIGKVFDQFYQADGSATRRHGGSGLGLAISKQLVGMMSGEIDVESKLGEGSLFRFSVPAPIASTPVQTASEPEAAPVQQLHILVAEDNQAMQQMLRALLEAGGHHVTIVPDGRAAVAAAASGTFDVILMDVMMPFMDGPSATQRIRELGGRAGGIPIIALTANALVGDRDRYLAVGMTDYLSKPIDVPALFAALAKVQPGR